MDTAFQVRAKAYAPPRLTRTVQACLTGTTALTVCLCEASTLTLADACSACAQSSTELDANLEALYTGYGRASPYSHLVLSRRPQRTEIPSVWCNGQAPGAQGTASPGDPVPILASDAAGATVSPTASPAEDAPLGVDPTGSATASELAAASPAPLSPGVGGAANDTGVVPPSDANPLSAPSSTAAPIARVAAAFVLGLVLACMSLVTR
jgi:hypothetical protein